MHIYDKNVMLYLFVNIYDSGIPIESILRINKILPD